MNRPLLLPKIYYSEQYHSREYHAEFYDCLDNLSMNSGSSVFYRSGNDDKSRRHICEIWENISKDRMPLKDIGIGVTGSKFAFTLENQKMTYQAIVKPMLSNDSFGRSLEITIKKLCNQHRPTDNLIKGDVRIKMITEVACYALASEMGFNRTARAIGGCDLVPFTTIVASQKKLQSMQLFIPNAIEAQAVFDPHSTDSRVLKFQLKLKKLESLSSYERFEEANFSINEIKIVQLFLLFDFFIGNQDRHLKNWLIILNDEGQIVAIIAIDNGGALPEKPLTENQSFFIEQNQYAWANLSLSKIKILPDIRELINKINKESIENAFYEMYKHESANIKLSAWFKLINEQEEKNGYEVMDSFMQSGGMKHYLLQRMDVLKSNHFHCPADLANYKTEKQFTT